MTERALPLASLLVAAAAIALAAVAFALALTIDTPTELSSTRYQIESKADVSAYVLVFLALALAVGARDAVLVGRAALGVVWAASVAASLAFCIVGVVLAYRATGFTVLHANAWAALARTTGFAALALGVLAAPIARRTALALAAGVGLAAIGTTVFSLTRGAGEPTSRSPRFSPSSRQPWPFPAAASTDLGRIPGGSGAVCLIWV